MVLLWCWLGQDSSHNGDAFINTLVDLAYLVGVGNCGILEISVEVACKDG